MFQGAGKRRTDRHRHTHEVSTIILVRMCADSDNNEGTRVHNAQRAVQATKVPNARLTLHSNTIALKLLQDMRSDCNCYTFITTVLKINYVELLVTLTQRP